MATYVVRFNSSKENGFYEALKDIRTGGIRIIDLINRNILDTEDFSSLEEVLSYLSSYGEIVEWDEYYHDN